MTYFNNDTQSSNWSNTSTLSIAEMQVFKLVLASIYFLLGFAMVTVDGILALTILVSKELRRRKEILFVFGLFLGDVVFGFAFLTSSINRYWLLSRQSPPLFLTPQACLLRPFVSMFLFGQQLSSFMMLMTSLDRLICECRLFLYLELGQWYRVLGFVGPFLLASANTVAAWSLVHLKMPHDVIVPPECQINLVFPERFCLYFAYAQHLPAFGSVLTYAAVMALFWYQRKQPLPEGVAKIQRQRQRDHTKVLGLVCLTDILLYTIPSSYVFPGSELTHQWPPMVAVCALYFSAVSRGLCAIANAAVFLWRPTDVREQLVRLWLRRFVHRRHVHPSAAAVSGTEGKWPSSFYAQPEAEPDMNKMLPSDN